MPEKSGEAQSSGLGLWDQGGESTPVTPNLDQTSLLRMQIPRSTPAPESGTGAQDPAFPTETPAMGWGLQSTTLIPPWLQPS